MLPALHVRFGEVHVAVSTHAAMVLVAVVAGLAIAAARARSPGFVLAGGPAIAGAALAGGWLFHRAVHGPPGGGLTSMGGVAAGALAAAVAARASGRRYVHVLDDLAPGAVFGLGIGRIGCFLAGCCLGEPTSLPWGTVIPSAGSDPRHPLQLYAAVFDLGLALMLVRTSGPPGAVAARGLFWLGLGRLVLEVFRDPRATDPLFAGWCSVARLGAASLVVAGLVLGRRGVDRSRGRRYLSASPRAR